ncbi:MAG: hypothetical protein CMJ75_21870 [Planctomycetaceae bacterium]|nr:hypothetical protein [Planctomycetaceae bacterium]
MHRLAPCYVIVFLLCAVASLRATEIETRRDVEFTKVAGESLHLDMWLQPGASNPAVIYVHGGGFTGGDKRHIETGFKPIFELLLPAGFSVVSVNYRVAPKHRFPAAPKDVQAAIAWLKRQSNALRIDPDRLALMGDSAGGMIVSYAGARPTPQSRVAAVVSFFGEHDFALRVSEDPCAVDGRTIPRPKGGCISGGMAAFLGFQELQTPAHQRILDEATVVHHVYRGMPQYLLLHGTRDYGVPIEQSHSLQQAMRRVGADCQLVPIVGGGHGIGGWTAPHQTHYKQRVIDWLRQTLGKPAP